MSSIDLNKLDLKKVLKSLDLLTPLLNVLEILKIQNQEVDITEDIKMTTLIQWVNWVL